MNRQILNDIIFIICGILVILLGIYLFKTQHKTNKDIVTIRWSVDSNPMRKIVVSEFEKNNPNIHVVLDYNPGIDTILTQLAGDVPPDIITAFSIESFRRLQKLDQLEDLTPYIKEYNIPVENLRKEVNPFVYVSEKDKRVYGIPENAGPFCLFYNKDVFDRFNVSYPTNNMTIDEILDISKKLTSYKTLAGRQVADTKGLYINEDYEFFIRMYGGRLFSPDGKKCLINSPEARKGMNFYSDLTLKHKVFPSSAEAESMAPTGGFGGTALLLAQGKVGMVISGRYLVIQFRDYYSKGLRLGMVRCPRSQYDNNLMYCKCYCIPKRARHKKEAIKFLTQMLTNENQTLIANYGDAWPSISNPNLDKIVSYNPKYPNEDNNKELLKDFAKSRVNELSPYINEVDLKNIMRREFDKVFLEEITMDKACENVEREVNKIINRNIANPNFIN